tara:strand:- start:303 stop:515 length:213 start_codon:yes stop_codon:yes gene_type:complete
MMQHIDSGRGRWCGSKSRIGYMSDEEFSALPKCPACFSLLEMKIATMKIATPEPTPAIREIYLKDYIKVK